MSLVKKTTTEYFCDSCAESFEQKNKISIGHSASGFAWIDGPRGRLGISESTELDFCSFDCLISYLKKELKE